MIVIDKKSYFIFSGGEVHFNKLPELSDVIMLKDYTMNGYMALAETVQVLDRHGIKAKVLLLPYLPYARQDRWMNPEQPFSLEIFASLINLLGFARVEIMDCHSDVGLALIDNSVNIEQYTIAKESIPEELISDYDVLFVSPDAGAYKKVSKLINNDFRIAIGVKNRDTVTGEINGTSVYSPVDLSGKQCIIVDDICDGGRTFTELAKVLKDKGASKVFLYVTHGIFSKGLLPLKDAGIDHIYTTNSFPQEVDNYLTVLDIKELMYE